MVQSTTSAGTGAQGAAFEAGPRSQIKTAGTTIIPQAGPRSQTNTAQTQAKASPQATKASPVNATSSPRAGPQTIMTPQAGPRSQTNTTQTQAKASPQTSVTKFG